jgi:hypothetical protein
MTKVKLNKANSLQDSNKNTTLQVNLSNNRKTMVDEDIVDTINEYSQYLNERLACDKIRLTCQVNVMASNVLFNYVTEVVKDEDSASCDCLNFTPHTISNVYVKKNKVWGENVGDCIKDTQLSKTYNYLVGMDIFNNHTLRSLNSIPIISGDTSDDKFNTIEDYLLDLDGRKPLSCAYSSSAETWMHMYNKDNIINTQYDVINERLVDKNGWFGFMNRSKMTSMDTNGNYLGIERVINNQDKNKFIEMYPNHTHFDFLPYDNKSRRRKEKNWEYCLCYPYSSTTENIPCINNDGHLRIVLIDEEIQDDDGLLKVMIISSCKHGLSVGDTINIFKNSEDGLSGDTLVEEGVSIDTVIDDYSFYVYLSDNLCERWVAELDKDRFKAIDSDCTLDYKHNEFIISGRTCHSFDGKVNCDFDEDGHIGCQNLSFCRTMNGEECQYYVRIFSRFPNFEFMGGTVDGETIYSEQEGLDKLPVNYYAQSKYEHYSVLSRMSYAKNIFNDNIHQITYTDDICFNYLHDNLGRPLSSLYLCFFKTNYGHKEWYNGNVGSDKVEHSHCFGKLNCGLELCPEAHMYGYHSGNTRVMNNVDDNYGGLSVKNLRNKAVLGLEDDEIVFDNMDFFYGDLCEYSKFNVQERILQPIVHRFNTQQRELSNSGLNKADKIPSSINFDKIIYDGQYDKDSIAFNVQPDEFFDNVTSQREGYVYSSSYEIPLRTWSNEVKTFKPIDLGLNDIVGYDGRYTLTTSEEHYLNKDYKVILYDNSEKKAYRCEVEEIVTSNSIICTIEGLKNKVWDVQSLRLYKVPDSVPDYIDMYDGVYRWRYLYENGFEDVDKAIEEYPFTNNCLYVNKLINIFVKRQDPFGDYGLMDEDMFEFEKLIGTEEPIERYGEDVSYEEKDSIC